MGILLVIVFLGLSSWTLVALFRRLRRRQVSAGWWVCFGALLGCGAALGIWCGFDCEYRLGSRYRIGSFSIPVVFFHLENGAWVDFPVPRIQAWLAAFTNVVTITALAMLPLWWLSWLLHKHEIPVASGGWPRRKDTGGIKTSP